MSQLFRDGERTMTFKGVRIRFANLKFADNVDFVRRELGDVQFFERAISEGMLLSAVVYLDFTTEVSASATSAAAKDVSWTKPKRARRAVVSVVAPEDLVFHSYDLQLTQVSGIAQGVEYVGPRHLSFNFSITLGEEFAKNGGKWSLTCS